MSSAHPKSPSLLQPNPVRPGPDHAGPARRRPRIRPAAHKKAAPDPLDAACRLHDRALTWRDRGQYVRAATAGRRALALAERALTIKDQLLGPDHPDVAMTLNNLAVLAAANGQYGIAAPLYQRALAVFEACLKPTHPKVLTCRQNHDQLVRDSQRRTKGTARATYNA